MNSEQLLELTAQISTLNSMLVSLQKDSEKMCKENERLREEYESLKNDYKNLKEENDYLKRKLFGRSSEKSAVLNVGQLSLFDEAEMECDPELKEEITYQRAKRKRQKEDIKAKLDQLPQIDINYTLEDEHQICPSCGSRLKKVGKKLIRRELNYIPAKLEVHNIYQTTYECRTCKKGNKPYMYNAPIDAPVIPHSYATSESVAQVMVDKYVNCIPLYRQEQEWKRLGFQLSRATMANWIIIASNEWLTPIKERMHELLLEENYTHADESPVQVLNETGRKNTTKSYMWVYATIKESKLMVE